MVEEELVNYICTTKYEDLPIEVIDTAKNMILTIALPKTKKARISISYKACREAFPKP